ncbi:hypothetical protein BACI349Y_550010 [Bacillus sp. 349Y]|nr:hypothetical protein BACI349Y_550010 [Bacillus sp. 349Y]
MHIDLLILCYTSYIQSLSYIILLYSLIRGSVRKMRIYNAKKVPIIKKADFQSLKESTF